MTAEGQTLWSDHPPPLPAAARAISLSVNRARVSRDTASLRGSFFMLSSSQKIRFTVSFYEFQPRLFTARDPERQSYAR